LRTWWTPTGSPLTPGLAVERFEPHFEHTKMVFSDAARQHPEAFDEDDVYVYDPADRSKLDGIFGPYGDKSWTGFNIYDRVAAIEHLWPTDESRQQAPIRSQDRLSRQQPAAASHAPSAP
jgi:hypothetical protein